jgi:conjugative transposon TraN protein
MKKLFYFISLFFLICSSSKGQAKPKTIYLSFNKTVHLIFNSNVKYVDAGLEDILWKKEENMVKLATKSENFQETSLVVKTGDEAIYSFVLKYAPNIDILLYNISGSCGIMVKKNPKVEEIKIVNDSVNKVKDEKKEMEQTCKLVLTKEQNITDIDEFEKDVFVSLTNIFVYKDKLFFHFKVINNSNINYDVDYFYLTIQDKKKARASTIQPSNIDPVFTLNNFDRLPAQETKEIVLVTNKFTVPDKKILKFEMKESDGGRNFLFVIEKKLIYKAPALDE